MNLGHLALAQGLLDTALHWYRLGLHLAPDRKQFFEGLYSDWKDLKVLKEVWMEWVVEELEKV